MLSSYPKLVWCDIRKEFITCFATLTTAGGFGVGVWVYSLVSSPFLNTYLCKCVFIKKKEKKKEKRKKILDIFITIDRAKSETQKWNSEWFV